MKKFKFLKLIIIFCIIQILIFSYICLYVSLKGGLIPDALIYGFFAVFGLELGGGVWIKHSENKFKITGIQESLQEDSEEEIG